MKRYFFTFLLLLSISTLSFSQVSYEIRQALDFFRTNQMVSGDYAKMLEESNIEGSPFLNEEFIKGTIYTTAHQKYVDVPLRYNIFNDLIEFKSEENKILAIATPEIVDKIEFGNFQVFYLPFTNVKKVRKGFFILIEQGNASLYYKPQIFLKKATEAVPFQEPQPAKFIRQVDAYYLRIEPTEAKLIGNRKDLFKLFPDRKEEIATFVKRNKIKTNKVEDLRKLLQFYNSL